ncbi:hypothetical protein [Actinoplanes sp. L3-i22]|uniref:hypothetical protein n=1 Tax=Actinoplanes sp. L3-i22 TaxID=2836373 RepID=UPI001C85583A|nr:hypothetical protein [Actinoplanes sp. L3-i22]
MNESGPVARRQAELRLRVGEHLDSGEVLLGAVWIARTSHVPLISKITQWQGAPHGLLGRNEPAPRAFPAGSTAADLDRHLPEDDTAMALALTGARLLMLAVGEPPPAPAVVPPAGLLDRVKRLLAPAEPAPLPPLAPVWQCPRAGLGAVAVSDPEGRLALRFADGSGLSVDAPAMLATPFAEAAQRA